MSGTFNVRNQEIETKLRELADRISAELPGNFGFALFLVEFTEEPGGALFYISSAKREGMVPAIREWCARQVQ